MNAAVIAHRRDRFFKVEICDLKDNVYPLKNSVRQVAAHRP
jgi:hypothetical protein